VMALPMTFLAPVSPATAPNNGSMSWGPVRLQTPVSQHQQQWGGLVTTGPCGAGTVQAPGAILTSGIGGGRRPLPANLLPLGSRAVTMAAFKFGPQPTNARPLMSGSVSAHGLKTVMPSHLGTSGISMQLGAASQMALKPPSVSKSGGVTRLTAVTSTAEAAGPSLIKNPMVSLMSATHIQVP
jgi:hypothetical protein